MRNIADNPSRFPEKRQATEMPARAIDARRGVIRGFGLRCEAVERRNVPADVIGYPIALRTAGAITAQQIAATAIAFQAVRFTVRRRGSWPEPS